MDGIGMDFVSACLVNKWIPKFWRGGRGGGEGGELGAWIGLVLWLSYKYHSTFNYK